MAEGEAEEDDAALGDPVRSVEGVASRTVGSVRAGGSEGRGSGAWSSLSAVINAHPATAETNALASADDQVSPYTNTRSARGVPSSWSRSGSNTANAPSSTANATKSVTPSAEVGISIISPTSYAMATLYCSHHQPAPTILRALYLAEDLAGGYFWGELRRNRLMSTSSTERPLIGLLRTSA